MPNWVYNTIEIEGTDEDVDKFVAHTTTQPKNMPTDKWDEVPRNCNSGYPNAINTFTFASFVNPYESLSPEEYEEKWYEWNISNWDTKWDACSVSYHQGSESASLSFETAWSPPEKVFQAMVTMFPTLKFDIDYEEEQGWGARLKGENGVLTTVKTWDIPNSHQDYLDRDNIDGCVCSNDYDPQGWFDDCPGKYTPKYEVMLCHKFVVEAPSEELAKKAVIDSENGFDLDSNVELISSKFNYLYTVTKLEDTEKESNE